MLRIHNAPILYIILFSSATLFTGCPKEVPVAELSDARAEIERAESMGASDSAAEDLDRARSELIEAHAFIATEKFEDAKKKGQSSYEHAVLAQERAAPVDALKRREMAASSISDAEAANGDEFAADEMALSRKRFEEGIALLKEAEGRRAAPASPTIEGRRGIILKYREATARFREALDAAGGARSRSLGMADELTGRAANARKILDRAGLYEAERIAPNDFNEAKKELLAGERNIEGLRLKEARINIAAAERAAAAALMGAIAAKASKEFDHANRYVASSKKILSNGRGLLTQESAATIEDYVRAADEALTASKKDIETRDYESSIQNAQEAENLAQVIEEQIRFAADAAKRSERDVQISPTEASTDLKRGEQVIADNKRVAEPVKTGEWRTYTVKKMKPADCLWRIAEDKNHYGNGRFWRRIYEANREIIKNPNRIKPGMILRIPPLSGTFHNRSSEGDTPAKGAGFRNVAVAEKRVEE